VAVDGSICIITGKDLRFWQGTHQLALEQHSDIDYEGITILLFITLPNAARFS